MIKKGFMSVFLVLAIALMAGSVMADTSVMWTSPAEGATFNVSTTVNPEGSASASGIVGGTGLDLALVIDESGSMSGARLAAAKQAATALVQSLPQDTTSVAVIGFDSSAHTYRVLTALNPDINSVIAAINIISAGGGTYIGSGIATATQVIQAGHTDGRLMTQVVLSDGATSYYSQTLNAAQAAYSAGITVHTVGVPGHSPTQMSGIANAGGGVYTNVTNLSDLEDIFNGTGGNLVGIDHVDIELPDGTMINDIAIDGLGNFTLPDWAIQQGVNTFTAYATGTDGTTATAVLNLNGVNANNPVPEPGTIFLMGFGLLGLAVAGRKKMR